MKLGRAFRGGNESANGGGTGLEAGLEAGWVAWVVVGGCVLHARHAPTQTQAHTNERRGGCGSMADGEGERAEGIEKRGDERRADKAKQAAQCCVGVCSDGDMMQ